MWSPSYHPLASPAGTPQAPSSGSSLYSSDDRVPRPYPRSPYPPSVNWNFELGYRDQDQVFPPQRSPSPFQYHRSNSSKESVRFNYSPFRPATSASHRAQRSYTRAILASLPATESDQNGQLKNEIQRTSRTDWELYGAVGHDDEVSAQLKRYSEVGGLEPPRTPRKLIHTNRHSDTLRVCMTSHITYHCRKERSRLCGEGRKFWLLSDCLPDRNHSLALLLMGRIRGVRAGFHDGVGRLITRQH